MKIILKTTTLTLVFLCCLFSSNEAKATHMMGSEITYKCIAPLKYKVLVRIYRDCTGVNLGSIQLKTSCGTNSVNISPTKTGIRDVTPTCNSISSSCQSNASLGIGIEVHTFEFILDLNKAPYSTWSANGCKEFTISWSQCCRNGEITTGARNKTYYNYCTINVGNSKVNSSPQFVTSAQAFLCCNEPIKIAAGAIDLIDYDSISYKLVDPLSGPGTKISFSTPFTAKYPMTSKCRNPANINCKPVPQAKPPLGFYLNELSGEIVFTPTKCDEVGVVCIEMTEWRKDTANKYVQVGTVRRDMQFIVQNCGPNSPPVMKFSTKKLNIDANLCAPRTCVKISASDLPPVTNPNGRKDSIQIIAMALPAGVTATYYNQNTRNPSVDLCFDKVSNSAFGKKINIILQAKDDACPLNSLTQEVIVATILPKDSVTHIRGYSFEDTSKNCKRENGEEPTIQRKIAYGNKNIYVKTAEDGSYGLCVATGKDTIRVMPHPFYFNDCPEVIHDFKLDSIYNIDFGTKGKKGIWGKVYTSTDKSCDTTKNLKPIPQIQLIAMPGSYQSTTDDYGNYVLNVPAGTYKVFVKDARKNYDLCVRDTLTVVVKNANDVIKNVNFYFKGPKVNYFIGRGATALRKGRYNKICFNVKDLNKVSLKSSIKVKVELPLKSGDTIKSSSATKITGNIVEWEIKNFNTTQQGRVCLRWYIGVNWSIGDTLSYKAQIDSSVWKLDTDTTNNYSNTFALVRNSYDPNIKLTYQDSIVTPLNRDLDYNVQFQNEGNDTAYYVEVRDTLNEHLDLNTFKMRGASHDYNYFLLNNVLHVIFDGINLSAKSQNEENSISNFSYSIKTKDGITKETKIPNSASIYFDLNPPVHTNTHQNVVKSPIEVLSIDDTSYCAGENAKLTYQTWYNPIKGNNFNIELSNEKGDFTNAVVIKSISKDSMSGELNFDIPRTAKTGTYKIRLKGTTPVSYTFEEVYSKGFKVVELQGGSIVPNKDSLCAYDAVTLDINQPYVNAYYYGTKGILDSATKAKSFGPFASSQKIYAMYLNNGCKHYTDTLDLFVSEAVKSEIDANLEFCDYHKNQVYKRKLQSNENLLSNTIWKVDASTKINNGIKETLSYNYPQAGTYSIELTTESIYGCKHVSSKSVKIIAKPDASFTTDVDTTCTNIDFQFTPKSTIGSHDWNFGDGNTGTQSNGFIFPYSTSGNVTVSHFLSVGKGCKDTATKELVILDKPVATYKLANKNLCLGSNDKVSLNYTKQNSFEEIMWNFGDGYTSGQESVTHNYSAAGKYNIELLVTVPGCSNKVTKEINISPQPKVSFTTDKTSYCEGEDITLTNSSKEEGVAKHQWSINKVTEFTTPDGVYTNSKVGNNTFKLVVTNLACSDSSETSLEVIEVPIIRLEADEVCEGNTTNISTFLDNLPAASISYEYNFGDGNSDGPIIGISPVSHTYKKAGSFTAFVTGEYKGCKGKGEINVIVNPNPVADFTFSDLPGSFLTLLISNSSLIANKSMWTKETITFQEDNNSFELTFNKPGEYKLKLMVESKDGCLDSIEKTVNVIGKGIIFAPTAFTPNGDNLNDFWAPFSIQQTDLNFKIFNRWGEMVFNGKDLDKWDGTYGNSPAKLGTYIYVIESTDDKGKKVKTNGHFQLIR